MRARTFNNADIKTIDWCRAERLTMLSSIRLGNPVSMVNRSIGDIASDATAQDSRSVKASLLGAGDLRIGWWNLNQHVHAALNPGSTVEDAMFAFHRRHHAITLWWLQIKIDYFGLVNEMRGKGIVEAIRSYDLF